MVVGAATAAPLSHAARPASGERVSAPVATPTQFKADEEESLRYDSFSAFNCSADSFTVDAVAHLNVHGTVSIEGTTTLNGVPYDSYFADLGEGPDSFATNFGRDFTGQGKPLPPASASYTFVFNTVVKTPTKHIGRTVTKIRCTNGALEASSAFSPDQPYSVPVGGPGAIVALGLALAALAGSRLARTRA
ncbi:MAG: hypothetical protein J0L91_02745 [Burkholderiales bacterium]|nr:hypothetical protein [Burkholderiales bacterium]